MSIGAAHRQGSLGPCCGCRSTKKVRTIVMLPKRCLVPGHGWGCVVCGLPAEGASVVLCDACARRFQNEPMEAICVEACRGYPATDGRAPLVAFTEAFRHRMEFHPEAAPGDPG